MSRVYLVKITRTGEINSRQHYGGFVSKSQAQSKGYCRGIERRSRVGRGVLENGKDKLSADRLSRMRRLLSLGEHTLPLSLPASKKIFLAVGSIDPQIRQDDMHPTSMAERLSKPITLTGSPPEMSWSRASPSECAGSVLMTSVLHRELESEHVDAPSDAMNSFSVCFGVTYLLDITSPFVFIGRQTSALHVLCTVIHTR